MDAPSHASVTGFCTAQHDTQGQGQPHMRARFGSWPADTVTPRATSYNRAVYGAQLPSHVTTAC